MRESVQSCFELSIHFPVFFSRELFLVAVSRLVRYTDKCMETEKLFHQPRSSFINREALSVHCVVELLKYTNSKVLLDIRGHYFTQEDFDYITREHYNTLDRIKEVGDYQHMITCLLRGFP